MQMHAIACRHDAYIIYPATLPCREIDIICMILVHSCVGVSHVINHLACGGAVVTHLGHMLAHGYHNSLACCGTLHFRIDS